MKRKSYKPRVSSLSLFLILSSSTIKLYDIPLDVFVYISHPMIFILIKKEFHSRIQKVMETFFFSFAAQHFNFIFVMKHDLIECNKIIYFSLFLICFRIKFPPEKKNVCVCIHIMIDGKSF